MKSEPEGKKRKKKKTTKKKPRKNQIHPGRASLAAWVARAPSLVRLGVARPRPRKTWFSRKPGRATQAARPGPPNPGHTACVAQPKSREPSRAACVTRPRSCGLWSGLPLSDLVSLSLIWFDSFSLCDLIRSGEVRLRLRLRVFKIFLFINRVLETRFSYVCHVKKDTT